MIDFETKIKRLESLTKINLTDAEKIAAVEFFDFFIPKFDMLENVDTENVEPLFTVSSLVNVMRDDVSNKTISVDKLLENAPEQYNGYFVVPRILE
jgi:aspartyl-tRNA(Asn)/glutamyl-tRNA(Gln) amidotransferase subunit C